MVKPRYLTAIFLLAFGAGTLLATNAGAATGPPPSASFTDTTTVTTTWVHQCASMRCGYHEVGPGRSVRALCSTDSDGISWNLVVTASPWNPDVLIAGYVSLDALHNPERQDFCDAVGYPAQVAHGEWWAHSCPSMGCGYGVIHAGDLYRRQFSVAGEERNWDLVIDYSSPYPYLAGFISLQ